MLHIKKPAELLSWLSGQLLKSGPQRPTFAAVPALFQLIVTSHVEGRWHPIQGDDDHSYLYETLIISLKSEGVMDCSTSMPVFMREYMGTLAMGYGYDLRGVSMLLIKVLEYECSMVQIREQDEDYYLESTPRCRKEFDVVIRVGLRRAPETGHSPSSMVLSGGRAAKLRSGFRQMDCDAEARFRSAR